VLSVSRAKIMADHLVSPIETTKDHFYHIAVEDLDHHSWVYVQDEAAERESGFSECLSNPAYISPQL